MPDPEMDYSKAHQMDEDAFILQEYFPYLARVFYKDVSCSVSKVYTEEYDLNVSEWRTMAILGPSTKMTAMEIVEQSSMDKVSVSRAVARMEDNGLLEKKKSKIDRRSSLLCLSAKGKAVYRKIIPEVLEVERQLLNGLTQSDMETLRLLMEKIRNNAREIQEDKST